MKKGKKIFSELLGKTFSEETGEFDQKHKEEVDKVVSNFKFHSDDFLPYNTGEIIKTINKIQANTSPGEAQVQNIFLKHLPYEYVSKMLSALVNRVVTEGIPQTWKEAKITMIPKKEGMSRDPEKYRPISLTSCLGKLVERLIKKRLYGKDFLNNRFFRINIDGYL